MKADNDRRFDKIDNSSSKIHTAPTCHTVMVLVSNVSRGKKNKTKPKTYNGVILRRKRAKQ